MYINNRNGSKEYFNWNMLLFVSLSSAAIDIYCSHFLHIIYYSCNIGIRMSITHSATNKGITEWFLHKLQKQTTGIGSTCFNYLIYNVI